MSREHGPASQPGQSDAGRSFDTLSSQVRSDQARAERVDEHKRAIALAEVARANTAERQAREDYREALRNAVLAGCTFREIAERAGTVVSNVHRIANS